MTRTPFARALALALACVAPAAGATGFPERPVRIVVPYPPGGANDILGRLIGLKLTDHWKQQVVIDNRPGSAGNIGAAIASRAAPDGYTLLTGGAGTMTINVTLYRKLPFHTLRDFTPLAMLASLPLLVIVHPSLPAKDVPELIALARKRPGELNFMSPGIGTPGHLAGELFKRTTGTDMVHVPYKGGAAALNDLLAGQIHLSIYNMAPALPHVKANRLRALAVTGPRRSPVVPHLPTVVEAGVGGFEVVGWWGVFTQAAVPAPIVERLSADIVQVLRRPDTIRELTRQGYEPAGLTGRPFREHIEREIAKWATVIEASGARAD